MKRFALAIAAVLLSSCASQQVATLLPRGNAKPGSGVVDRTNNTMTVNVDGREYRGTMQMQTATSSTSNVFGIASTSSTTTNQATALLLGPAGQMRCELAWDALMMKANGVCIDRDNQTYDLIVGNPS